MPLIVAHSVIQHPGALSQPALLVLSCIDGGNEWLRHAIIAATSYHFEDELALVVAAQQGLHGTPLILLPRLKLLVGPARLIAVPAADLRALVAIEAGDESPVAAHRAQHILAAQALATADDLAGADALLKTLGVGGAALFQALSLRDRIALLELKAELAADGAPPAAAQKAAARFAVGWAYSPAEFADYFRAFLTLTTGTAPLGAEAAEAALSALAPMLFDTLDCPTVAGFVAPEELAKAVAAWIGAGRRIGFARLSHGVAQLVVHGGYRGEAGAAGQALVDAYLGQAQALLGQAVLDRARIAQDGATASFGARVPDQPGEAELLLDAGGAITLQRFVPAPAEGNSP